MDAVPVNRFPTKRPRSGPDGEEESHEGLRGDDCPSGVRKADVLLLEVTRRMTERAIGSALVVEDDALLGIVTDRDLALRGLGGGLAPRRRCTR